MALDLRSLVLMSSSPHTSGSPANKVWHYSSTDAAAAVVAAGYFNNARNQLSVNDLIICNLVVGGTGVVVFAKLTAVPTSGNVTCTSNTPSLA